MFKTIVKPLFIVSIALIGLQACTQVKVVRVPTPLNELISPYKVDLQWQLINDSLDYSDSEGLFFARDDRQLYYANTSGIVTAANIAGDGRWDDQIAWQRKFNAPIVSGPIRIKQGLIVGTAKAQLMLLSAENGSIQWQAELSSEVLSKAVVADDDYVSNAVFVRTVDGKLNSVNLNTGRVNWTVSHSLPKLSLRGIAPVTYHEGVVYVGWESGKVEALDASTGELKWQSQVVIAKGRTDLERLIDLQAEMVIKNGRLYVFGYHGKLVALNPDNGNLYWAKKISGYQDFIVDAKTLYLVDEDDILNAYDLSTGTRLWRQANFKYRKLADLVSYGDKFILLADGQGYFHWVDKIDGSAVARATHVELDNFGQEIVRVAVEGNKIFTLDMQGYVSYYLVSHSASL